MATRKDERTALSLLSEVATKGPWFYSQRNGEVGYKSTDDDQSYGMLVPLFDAHKEADGMFCAAAREAVPALLSDLEAAEAENATLRQQLAEARHRKAVELWGAREIKRRIHEAVAAEREACAQMVDVPQGIEGWEVIGGDETMMLLRRLAEMIRSRGNHA